MRHFRKRSSSTTASASGLPAMFEYIKQKLATLRPRTKDEKTLDSSSGILAPLIASPSPSCDSTDSILSEPESPEELSWSMAYEAARMAVEIASESADMFLPLKTVVGALSVLLRNHVQNTAIEDQIQDAKERVRLLRRVLASPVGDHGGEETARRRALRKRLAGIIANLEPLSEQQEITKFLSDADHVIILNGFVQDIAYAITDYQTSLQKSIPNGTRRIEETSEKVEETTEKIEGKTAGVDQTTDENYESGQSLINAADLELLGKLGPVRTAGYLAGHHDTCLRGTREPVLDGIMRWVKDSRETRVLWFNGLAGTGKSTIAQTISEMVAKTGTLGASFFCSRDYPDRNELKNIFPTLAFQLACRYPAFRSHIIRVIRQDPSVAQLSLISQLKDLIVEPLSSTKISCVIVVDALDECVDDQPASAILSVLGRLVEQLPFIKFIITGRPEPRIPTGFRLPLLESLTKVFLLYEVKPTSADEGIRLYLQEMLTVATKRGSNVDVSKPWPRDNDLVALTKKSSGFFIFASTLVRLVESADHELAERLQPLVTPSDSTERRAGIDPLYIQVLRLAFSDVKEAEAFAKLRRVLGAVILAFNPLSREQIAEILDINPSIITTTLRHLQSVLLVPNEGSEEIRVFHKSFPEFLQDRKRCYSSKFFIDTPVHHEDIAFGCFALLKKLKSNPCNLPDFVMNRDVSNLPELLEDNVGSATRYACGYWAMHVRSSPTTEGDNLFRLINSIAGFFKYNFVPWIEVMSLENRLESAIHSIGCVLDWLYTGNVFAPHIRSLAEESLRFTIRFFHLIQQSASHIYHSALPLSPAIADYRLRTLKTNIKAVRRYPNDREIVLRTITTSSKHLVCMTTFGHKIATAYPDGKVYIYDSTTGVLRLSLSLVDPIKAVGGSPDGSTLFCVQKTPSITVWDMQTGGLIRTVVSQRKLEDITVSLEGHYFACRSSDWQVDVWRVNSETKGLYLWNRLPATRPCWLKPEHHLAASTGESVYTWDVNSGKIVRRYTLRHPIYAMVYSRKLHGLAIMTLATQNTITFIDLRTGTSAREKQDFTCLAFSQTTGELVCGTGIHGIRVFVCGREGVKRVVRRGEKMEVQQILEGWMGYSKGFEYQEAIIAVFGLHNGTIVANFTGSGVQLLSLEGAGAQQSDISARTVHAFDKGRVVAVRSTRGGHLLVLDPATMSQLLKIPIGNTGYPAHILCASLKNRVAVFYFEKMLGTRFLQLWRFHEDVPKWTMKVGEVSKICRISPTASRLVTLQTSPSLSRVYVWNAENGQLDAQWLTHASPPVEIEFTSDTGFRLHYDTHHVSHSFPHWELGVQGQGIPPSSPEQPKKSQYFDLDATHEWVVSGSKKICWIPPEYIGSVQPSYCWIGCSLVMAGQDGRLRLVNFSPPS